MSKIWPEKNKKLCSRCKIVKDVSEFNKCSRNGVQSMCIPCRSEYQKRLTKEKELKKRKFVPIIDLDNEIWKPIKNYENYEISNYGRVKILEHSEGKSCYRDMIKKPFIDEKKYHFTQLCKNNKYKRFAIHRLVALEFCPNPNNYPVVHHKNHKTDDNHFSNLEWTTVNKNCSDIIRGQVFWEKEDNSPELKFDYSVLPKFLTDNLFKPVDEVWRNINDKLQISNYGRVRNIKTLKLRKPWIDSDDYLQHAIEDYGRKMVHRLVCVFFIPNINNLPQINHIDGNKFNNHVNNLEWISAKNNIKHSIRIGLRAVGEKHGFSKLKEKQVLEIRKLADEGIPINQIRKIYEVSNRTVGNIVKRRSWKHI